MAGRTAHCCGTERPGGRRFRGYHRLVQCGCDIPGRNVPGIAHATAQGLRYMWSDHAGTTTQVSRLLFLSICIHAELLRRMARKEYIFKGEGSGGIAADVFYPEGDSATTFPIGSWAMLAPVADGNMVG